ncbi:T7SS effector LXG polymorphic toxin [Peribacillus sp. NJ11]|uniref:T7SS effector LXG polymorphic toxin n=2 Tax=unclassified Peribacillus TaxID=2675266 RepID=UPI0025A032BF|nr:T7SS effector LXG polymorphic toxin [Peribacillus sp. NJ11]MDM5223060.1 T7SS effector LXG polymorphic toxin [Peribacillus sp. NJ11]
MKIYEAKTLTAATKSRAKQYEELKKEVAALKKEFQGIVGLDNEFQGAGATAIKSFYEAQIEVADAWMELFTTQISFLEGIPASLEEADLSGNTVVEVPFLDGEVSTGINQAKSLVDEQASDLQRILNSIDDILPLDMFNQNDFNEKITLAGQRLDDTVTKVENVDRQLVEEYDVSVGQENVAVGLFRALLDATKQDGNVSPMTFNQSAFKNSDVYQVKDEVAGQMKDYQTFKKQQAEAQKIEREMEELENRPWYEKAWDTTKTFTGEFTGYYDSIRASTGVDPVTGRKLSDAERIAAGAMAAAGFIPVVGWAGRAIKGGSALYKTAKGLNAANHALDAYKTTKGFSLLQKTEYGIYGLLAANGLGEAVTGKDMFGNQLTEEQRQNGLLMALGIGGVAGAAKVADKVASGTKFIPYSKEFAQKQVQKVQATITDIAKSGKTTLKNIGEELGKKEIPKRISVEQVSLAGGPSLPQVVMEKQTIKEAYQKFTVKDRKVEGVSGKSVPKGTGEVKRLIPGSPGKVTGGSSTKLGKNMFEEMGLPKTTKRTPYQAQHIIPKEFRSHPVLIKIGMDMDDASNGFFLRVPDADISTTSRHKGYHSVYSNFVRKKLDEIDVSQDISKIEMQVFELQQKLRTLQEKGLPLYMKDAYLEIELKRIKEIGLEQYKIERMEKEIVTPVWKRGGGATVDLWERWYNK